MGGEPDPAAVAIDQAGRGEPDAGQRPTGRDVVHGPDDGLLDIGGRRGPAGHRHLRGCGDRDVGADSGELHGEHLGATDIDPDVHQGSP